MIDIDTLTEEQFLKMPLVAEGESRVVRYAGRGLVVIRFKPTICSFTANRASVVEGSDVLRLRATAVFLSVLRAAGIPHAYHSVNDRFVLSEFLMQPASLNGPAPFVPSDMPHHAFYEIPVAPPIEVVVERFRSGTPKHRYPGMSGYPVRPDHPLHAGMRIQDDHAYPTPIVRFEWRNPLRNATRKALADEVLGDEAADLLINVIEARKTARRVYAALEAFLDGCDIICYDLRLFITEDGKTVFGEISQDCGRFRHRDLGSLDKDVWCDGGSNKQVLDAWRLLYEHISRQAHRATLDRHDQP